MNLLEGFLDRPEWHDRAACRGADPDLFFPDRGRPAASDVARATCRRCPVKSECLEFALSDPSARQFGIWGDTNSTERKAIRRRRLTLVDP